MKNIELYLWWSCGKLDGDGYETDYEVSDNDYNTIVSLIKKYAEENCDEEDGIYVDPQDFTEEFFYKSVPELYNQIYEDVKSQLTETAIAEAEDWFDEEEEGCTVEEYLDNCYSYGFYFTEEFLASIFKLE